VIFGVIGEVGEIGGQRIACPLAFERVHPKDPSEKRLWQILLGWVQRHLSPDEVAVMDAGVKLANVQAARLGGYLLRLPTNFTARRNQPAPHAGKGRKPVYGQKVRPLARTFIPYFCANTRHFYFLVQTGAVSNRPNRQNSTLTSP
jgi:hypothetical protein